MALVPANRIVTNIDTMTAVKNCVRREDVVVGGTMDSSNTSTYVNFRECTPVVQITASKKWRTLVEVLTGIQTATANFTGLTNLYGLQVGDKVSVWDESGGVDLLSNVTILAIDHGAGTLTLSSSTTTAVGDYIYLYGVNFERCGVGLKRDNFSDIGDFGELLTSDKSNRILLAGVIDPDHLFPVAQNARVLARLRATGIIAVALSV